MTLGRHEEFTRYAAVALAARGDAERDLFALAKAVDGWGRIELVERLADTHDETIKAWMLREGYKNSVMYEYLAYTCATAGGLRAALASERVDPELLAGAGDLIVALINGGPAEDINDYADGAAVAELYLKHLGPQPRSLDQLVVVDHLLHFLDQPGDWKAREARSWTPELRARLRLQCAQIEKQPYWPAMIHDGLQSTDRIAFATADDAARALAIDTWNEHFARLEAGDDFEWYAVMQTDDPARIDAVVALAEQRIPLDKIGTGPAKELGIGPQWSDHSHLDFVLQDLRRFPGKGWPLIKAGVRSPVIRNRHMALRALSKWGKSRWPSEVQPVLEAALKDEPDQDVKTELQTVLAGKTIDEPKGSVQ